MVMWKLVIPLAAFVTAGCTRDYIEARLDRRVIGVRGVIRDAAQAPVTGAGVAISAYLGPCSGAVDGSAITQSGEGGRFVTVVSGSDESDPRCIRVTASKGALNGSAVLSLVVFPKRFPTDTVEINVVVR